jgi:hypothetical protein
MKNVMIGVLTLLLIFAGSAALGIEFAIESDGVGIGTNPNAVLHVYEGDDTDDDPMLLITQDGDTTGDSSQRFFLLDNDYTGTANGSGSMHVANINFTIGIDTSDMGKFKIAHHFYDEVETWGNAPLTGSNYSDANTMITIHPEYVTYNPVPLLQADNIADDRHSPGYDTVQKPGIIDFNHQSRARAYLNGTMVFLPTGVWTKIPFDSESYDEHSEMDTTTNFRFTATKEGYYQVNARLELMTETMEHPDSIVPPDRTAPLPPSCFASIAIYHVTVDGLTTTMYAQGNNLQLTSGLGTTAPLPPPIGPLEPHPSMLYRNNAPNVSDVVYLQAGESLEIHGYQDTPTPLPIEAGSAKTYVSIHKAS